MQEKDKVNISNRTHEDRVQGQDYNPARHALFMADGVVFLFDRIIPFEGDAKVCTGRQGELYFVLGRNVIKLTKEIERELDRHRTLFLYTFRFNEYVSDSSPVGIEITKEAWEKVKEVMKGKD